MTVARSGNSITIPFEAKADLNASQYHFVQTEGLAAGSVNMVNVGTGASNPGPLGVLQNDPKAAAEAAVTMVGPTYVRANAAGSTIHQGRFLCCGSDGHAEPTNYVNATTGSPLIANAISLSHTTADDVLIEAFVFPAMIYVTGS
jgi:hypothetical protein